MAKNYRRVMSAKTLIGDEVTNSADENLGKIEEFMIDTVTGKIAYAVLSFGGILGIGDKLFAIPWSKLRLSEEEKKFILDVDKKVLEKAPGFDKDNWPDFTDPTFEQGINSYYGVKETEEVL